MNSTIFHAAYAIVAGFVICISAQLAVAQDATIDSQFDDFSDKNIGIQELSISSGESVELGDSLKAFEPFLGNWEVDAEWSGGGGKLWARNEYRIGLGGNFVEAKTFARDGDDGEPYERYRTVFSHDAENDKFVSYGFTFDGTVQLVENQVQTVDGRTVITSQFKMGGGEIRQEVKMLDDASYSWKVWQVGGDDELELLMDAVGLRVE